MRGVLLLVVGLGVGLAAGWVLFASGRQSDRAAGTRVALGAAETASTARPEAERTGAVGGQATAPSGARPASVVSSEEQIVRQLMREAYDARVRSGKAPEGDLFEAGVREVMRRTAEGRDSYARNLGSGLEYREQTRAEMGDISGSPLLLQICVAGSGRARLAERGNSGPFQVGGPPTQGANLTHVTGGMVPPGSMFLIERVVLRAHAAPRGRVNATLPETDEFHWDTAKRSKNAIETELKGLVRLRHGYERTVSLDGYGVAASLEVHGRLVPEAEGESTPTRPLTMGDGWLTGEPVLMQVLADHGGGNPNTVHLNGDINQYVGSLADGDLWSETVDLRKLDDSSVYYRGCGRVPAGKALRITRADYRARLDPEGATNSYVEVRIGGKEAFRADASKGTTASGSWTGEVLVLPGREEGVSLTCAYYALAEMTVFGELVDEPGAER